MTSPGYHPLPTSQLLYPLLHLQPPPSQSGVFLSYRIMGPLADSSVCHVTIQDMGPSWTPCSWVPGTLPSGGSLS